MLVKQAACECEPCPHHENYLKAQERIKGSLRRICRFRPFSLMVECSDKLANHRAFRTGGAID